MYVSVEIMKCEYGLEYTRYRMLGSTRGPTTKLRVDLIMTTPFSFVQSYVFSGYQSITK